MKRLECISEYSSLKIPDYKLTEEERDYLTRLATTKTDEARIQRFYFDELVTGLTIHSLSWVGVIELTELRISIQPKFNHGFQALIDMICFAEHIPFHQWQSTQSELGQSDFLELFVRLILRELDKLWQQGIVKEYVMEEENLRQVRGRPDPLKNLQLNHSNPTRIYCRFDELVTDIAENQVILLALEAASRVKLSAGTQRKLSRYRTEFSLLCESYNGNQWPKFTYHRLNMHYQPIHKLCRYLIERISLSNLYRFTDENYFSLLIDMNKLFEKFIAAFFERFLGPEHTVESQKRVTKAITQNGVSYRHIIPDLVVKERETSKKIVFDTKYKNYNRKLVANEDIYQLSFYAQYFHTQLDSPHHSVIVYPRYADERSGSSSLDLLAGTAYSGTLQTMDISIEDTLELIKRGAGNELKLLAARFVRPL